MENRDILLKALNEIGLEVDTAQIDKFIKYKNIMLDWNEKINLTSITDELEIYIKHFVDSATCISTGYIKDGMSLIDVGTGAGFPGVPIKILKDNIHITLLDSLNKRINYLENVVAEIQLEDVELLHKRAEEGGTDKNYREKFDIAIARAVASMNVLCEYCLPFVKVGGYFLCQKGPSYKEELEGAKKALDLLGGRVKDIKEYNLPYSDIRHYIIIIEKIFPTPTKYPRKPGKPASNPL